MKKFLLAILSIMVIFMILAACNESRLEFVFDDVYYVGDTMEVKLANNTYDTISYTSTYAACQLHYYDENKREFIIPPGTHCDQISPTELKPFQTVLLFEWNLTECTEDRWGCIESAPLLPGVYKIEGEFMTEDRAKRYTVSKNFEIKDKM